MWITCVGHLASTYILIQQQVRVVLRKMGDVIDHKQPGPALADAPLIRRVEVISVESHPRYCIMLQNTKNIVHSRGSVLDR